jgi:hypothetical protein
MKYYSEKSILVKQINDIIYTISTGGVQYPKKAKSSINPFDREYTAEVSADG